MMMLKRGLKYTDLIIVAALIVLLGLSCKKVYAPKPRGYFRIDFPEKQYQSFGSDCKFGFEAPVYTIVKPNKEHYAEPCWYNIEFTGYNANVYLTFKELQRSLPEYIEDVRSIVYKHSIKADDIIETPITNRENKVYGMLYDIKGNVASSINFYLTDSTSGFVSGALYFNTIPNEDSLSPAISFIREDILHLIDTFDWKQE